MAEVTLPSEFDWHEVTIPGSVLPVLLARLSVNGDSGVSQSLIRFPAGWSRPSSGWYSVSEEILMVEGELRMSGATYRVGDYAYLPASYLRSSTTAEGGCLVLASFGGKPRWSDDAQPGPGFDGRQMISAAWNDLVAQEGPLGQGYRLRQEGATSVWVIERLRADPVMMDVECVSLADLMWARVAAGDRLPRLRPPVYCRTIG